MRYTLLSAALLGVLLQANETCYTVQLLSLPVSAEGSLNERYPAECKRMRIGATVTVRCGCDTNFDASRERMKRLGKDYRDAFVTTTYAYRFDTVETPTEPVPVKKQAVADFNALPGEHTLSGALPGKAKPLPVAPLPTQTVKAVAVVSAAPQSKGTCYSVQLASGTSQSALERLVAPLEDASCKTMRINGSNALRCGCFTEYAEAKNRLAGMMEDFPKATVVTSYAYRFGIDASAVPPEQEQRRPARPETIMVSTNADDEQLRLMYQVFIYASDLDNAYAVAKRALVSEPESLYWHQKAAEVARWLDKREASVEHYLFVYRKTRDEALEKEMLAYFLQAYNYTAAAPLIREKVMRDPSPENIKEMIFVYDRLGEPETAAAVLKTLYAKEPAKNVYLAKALQIYLDVGEMEMAETVVSMLEAAKADDVYSLRLLSYFYFLQRDTALAYSILSRAATVPAADAEEFYRLRSDLGWYMQDFDKAAEASLEMITMQKGRQVDYERVMQVYRKKDPSRVTALALEAFERFEKQYFFFIHAYAAMDAKETELLYASLEKALQSSAPFYQALLKEPLFWQIKAQLHEERREHAAAEAAYAKAWSMAPQSVQIALGYLWFLIDNKRGTALEKVLLYLQGRPQLDRSLWLAMGVGWFQLQHSDRAFGYIDRLIREGTDSVDVKLLYAYIMQVHNNEAGFFQTMREVYAQLSSRLKGNAKLFEDADFLERYLKVAMYFEKPERFESLLAASKRILSERTYTEISIFWALQNQAYERAHELTDTLAFVEPWMRLNMALNFNDRFTQETLLYRYMAILPIRDRVQTARDNEQIAVAQTLAFEGLEANSYDYLLYQQMRDLVSSHADDFDLQAGSLQRSSLSQYYFKGTGRHYLARGYSLALAFESADNTLKNRGTLAMVPYYLNRFEAGITKRFDRASITAMAGYAQAMQGYATARFYGEYRFGDRLTLGGEIAFNDTADETVQLLLGGKKDHVTLKTNYALLPSTMLNASLSSSRYSSQDGVSLGEGVQGRAESQMILRSGYPDLAWKLFGEAGTFDPRYGSKGVIDVLSFNRTTALPQNYWNAGTSLHYGMENRYNYVRVWRPYFELIPYYSGHQKQFSTAFSAGFGGMVIGQDNLAIGFDYTQSVNGIQEKTKRLYLNYRIFY